MLKIRNSLLSASPKKRTGVGDRSDVSDTHSGLTASIGLLGVMELSQAKYVANAKVPIIPAEFVSLSALQNRIEELRPGLQLMNAFSSQGWRLHRSPFRSQASSKDLVGGCCNARILVVYSGPVVRGKCMECGDG